MIVWGGYAEPTFFPVNTGGRYNPDTDSWIATSTTNAAEARALHTAIWNGNEMIVWGGNGEDNDPIKTGGRYCAQSGGATPTPTATPMATATSTPTSTVTPTATATETPRSTRPHDRALRQHRTHKVLPIITVVGKAFWDLGQAPKATGYAEHWSRSHNAPIRVCDATGNVIVTD
jgi:hypothetical protein